MIQPLRRVHFWIWVFLSTLLFALFCAGLMVRRPTTPNNTDFRWEQLP